jgi:uncharacterized membrane protein YesL
MFNPKGNGKGLTKEEANKPKTIGRFPRYFFSNFNMMFALNIFFFLGNFPILFGLFALSGKLNIETTAPVSSLFSPLYGAVTIDGHNPVSLALMGIHGAQTEVSFPTTATWVFFGLTALVIFTFGIVNTAIAYIMRNLVKGDSITFISDIKYCIKRNFKQALILGILDPLFLLLVVYDVLFFYTMAANAIGSFLFGMMLIIAMMYFMMRPYMYIMIVTFDLKLIKVLKNSFIFMLIGFKRNIVAFLGCVAVWIVDYLIMMVIFPVGIILPVLFLMSLTTFMGIYAAYPKIKEIMIDPYYVSDDVGARSKDDMTPQEDLIEEPIFKDRG